MCHVPTPQMQEQWSLDSGAPAVLKCAQALSLSLGSVLIAVRRLFWSVPGGADCSGMLHSVASWAVLTEPLLFGLVCCGGVVLSFQLL